MTKDTPAYLHRLFDTQEIGSAPNIIGQVRPITGRGSARMATAELVPIFRCAVGEDLIQTHLPLGLTSDPDFPLRYDDTDQRTRQIWRGSESQKHIERCFCHEGDVLVPISSRIQELRNSIRNDEIQFSFPNDILSFSSAFICLHFECCWYVIGYRPELESFKIRWVREMSRLNAECYSANPDGSVSVIPEQT